jgi:hypothetical protein
MSVTWYDLTKTRMKDRNYREDTSEDNQQNLPHSLKKNAL